MCLKQQVLDALLLVASKGPTEPKFGICCSVHEYYRIANQWLTHDEVTEAEEKIDDLLSQLMLGWPKHSGNKAYPIADPSGRKEPSAYFWSDEGKWDLNTTQGLLRLELLIYTIDQLKILLSKS